MLAILCARPDLKIVGVNANNSAVTVLSGRIYLAHTLADLGDLAAFDAVLVDINNPKTSDVLNLLRARPDLTVIGVNTASSALTVLTGKVYLARNLNEVIECLA